MDNWTAYEASYKNGYEKGYEAGQKDAIVKFLTSYQKELQKMVGDVEILIASFKAE